MKVTYTLQDAPAANVFGATGQVFTPVAIANSGELLDVATILPKGAVPVLLKVTICAAEVESVFTVPNARDKVESDAAGALPVPLNNTVCCVPGRPMLLSVTVKVPVIGPDVVGLNTTLIVQLAVGNKLPLAGQVPGVALSWKSFSVVLELKLIALMSSGDTPELVSVTV